MPSLGLKLGLSSALLGGVKGSPGPSGPSAPFMSMDPAWTSANAVPLFNFVVDDTISAGDSITVQIRAAGGTDWATLVASASHPLAPGEDLANAFTFSWASLSNGNYEASSFAHHTVDGARSNVVPFTVAAASTANYRIASTGNRRISSAGNYRKAS